ncbi:MAG: formylglycine-generating enzyme family protein [Magnetococcales bacterium]|nr:formylglycine-generating enzyme family protein [Magnetococcales bacterium]
MFFRGKIGMSQSIQMRGALVALLLSGTAWADAVGPFVSVPGGTFEMGCGPWQVECEETEKPVQTVVVNGFDIGKYEVTQKQWQAVMGTNPSRFVACGENCPVEQVTWKGVQEFIEKLNAQGSGKYRLPTEAEWEYACRSAGKPEHYCGGNDLDAVAWYKLNATSTTHPVGQKAPNGLGIHDMSGNVWEWTCSEYGKYEEKATKDSTQCRQDGNHWVFRGGGWNHYPEENRSTVRQEGSPNISFSFRGFRLVRMQ